jgi:hypothetical protein
MCGQVTLDIFFISYYDAQHLDMVEAGTYKKVIQMHPAVGCLFCLTASFVSLLLTHCQELCANTHGCGWPYHPNTIQVVRATNTSVRYSVFVSVWVEVPPPPLLQMTYLLFCS